ncbi:MAG: DNA mismatch endonuclease Vsr [Limisphaerales bacterium]
MKTKSPRPRNFQGRNFSKKRRADPLTPRRRSKLMSAIRSSGSKLETNFLDILRSRCAEPLKVNDSSVFGKPDIVFHRQKLCVFLDSDFWHGWQYPRWKHLLKSDFWRGKIERNRKRDNEVTRKLRREGWTVIRLWEHNLQTQTMSVIEAVVARVTPGRKVFARKRPQKEALLREIRSRQPSSSPNSKTSPQRFYDMV